MPQVPMYERQVSEQSTPNVRFGGDAPITAFGGGQSFARVSEAVTGTAGTVIKVADQQRKEADDALLLDAENKLIAKKHELLYGENGALSKKGKDSFDALKVYNEEYDKYNKEISAGFSAEQALRFNPINAKHKLDLSNDIEKHTFNQTEIFRDETYKNGVEAQQNEAALNWHDPNRIQYALDAQADMIRIKNQGLGEEITQNQIDREQSKTHAMVIEAMLASGADQAADKYFKENGSNIKDADVRSQIEKRVKDQSVLGEGQRQADLIIAKTRDLEKGLAEAKKIQDPKVRDEVEKRIEHARVVRDAVKEEREKNNLSAINKLAESTRSIEAVRSHPGWSTLSTAEKNATEARINTLVSGGTIATDRSTYKKLADMAANDREAFLKENLDTPVYANKLSESDFKKFSDMQAEAKSGNSGKLDGFMSDTQVVDSVMIRNGLDPRSKSNSMEQKVALFRSRVDMEVQQFEQRTGKKATNEDVRKIANKLSVQVVTDKGFFYDTKKAQFELGPGDEVKDIVVPPEDLKAIRRALDKTGKPYTKDDINRVYLRGINRGG